MNPNDQQPLVRTAQQGRLLGDGGDRIALAVVLLVFLLVNFVTASRFPYPWIDEVLNAEPAINLATGRGFTAAAWQTSASDAVFASPYPLYLLLLGGWTWLLGIGQLSLRSFPIVITAAAIVVIWFATRRLNLVVTTRGRVWLSALIACDYGFAFSYRGVRPDCLAVLLLAAMFHSFSWRSPSKRYSMLFVSGVVIAAGMGLHVVAFCLLLGTALIIFLGRTYWKEAVSVAAGLLLGVLCFYAVYRAIGIWPAFQEEMRFQGGSNLFARIRERLTTNPIRNHSINIPKDLSLAVLGLAMMVTTVVLVKRRALPRSSLGVLGLLVAVIIPAGLYFGLRFSTYYSWMAFIPLAVIYCGIWSQPDFAGPRRALTGLQLLACLVGLPLQLAIAAYDWNERNPASVRQFVNDAIREDDVVYCDWTAYFPAKAKAARVYLPKYLLRITPEEAASVTVAIVSPHKTPRLDLDIAGQLAMLGGEWVPTGDKLEPAKPGLLGNNWQAGFLSLPNYALEVYRRKPGS